MKSRKQSTVRELHWHRILIAQDVEYLRCTIFLLYDSDDYVVMEKLTLSIPGS
mgnify:FL=1